MYRVMLLISALGLVAGAQAQESFDVSSLSASFVDGSDVVVRLDETEFEVSSPGRAVERRRFVATVFNKEGQGAGEMAVWYDKFRKVKKLEGRVLDATGRQIRKLGRADVSDVSATSGSSLYDDNRVRVGFLREDVYPYTVDFSYEVEYKGLLNWPDWQPQYFYIERQQRLAPVERTVFRISAPQRVGMRYRLQHLDLEPERALRGDRETLTWTSASLPAYKPERYGPTWRERVPSVLTAPTMFEIEEYSGQMETWEKFGSFYAALSDGRRALPPEARADVQRLTADLTDNREKARVLYQYLQERTRYVSVQLGIGGWQPFDAQYVHSRGYGDCKALTNYMKALLAEAGIASYPALIRGGARVAPILDDFPSNQFNHVILYVPLESDTLWLETTSQTNAFGHLGSFTGDRNALVVQPRSSFMTRTPPSGAGENARYDVATVTLTGSGSAQADLEMRFTGEVQGRILATLYGHSARERLKWLQGVLEAPSFDIKSADYSSVDARADTVRLAITVTLPRYGSASGSRMFVPINPVNRWKSVPEAQTTPRTQPVVFIQFPFYDDEVVEFVLPSGFTIEALPAPVTLETPFGRYEAKTEVGENGRVRYTRVMEMTQPRLPAEQYEALRDFLEQVTRADRAQMVLKKG